MKPFPRLRGSLRRALTGALPVWYHPAFRLPFAGLEAETGMDPKRADNVLTWIVDEGIVRAEDVRDAVEAPWSWIAAVHDAEYLAGLDQPEAIARIVGLDARRLATGPILEVWRRAVGATVAAAEHVVAHGGRAASLLGGFHHAGPARGAGFCGLDDVAIAIDRLRKGGFDGRVLVLDLDAHPPDGLAACVADDDRVEIRSLGVASTWESAPSVADHRVAQGSGDDVYLARLDDVLAHLPPAGVAFLLAGADPLAGDRFGGLACTEAGLRERDRRALHALGATPTVILPSGGYTPGAWRVFAGTLAEAAGSRATVPEGYDPILRRTRKVSRALDPGALGTSSDEPWITEEDVLGALHVTRPAEPRLMGFYTRQGIEYALERHGILDALRRMGFSPLEVEIAADAWPHRVRVLAPVAGKREALVEVSVSRRVFDGFDTLFVEWLALRDPRAPFTGDRPRLPGQDAPGLGLAEEMVHILVRMAERLGLAGVSFVPAHYHVAWVARRSFRFVEPDVQGRFVGLCDALAKVPLGKASALLDGQGIATEDGDVLKWRPEPMVLPLDRDFAAKLDQAADRVRAIAEATEDRVIRP